MRAVCLETAVSEVVLGVTPPNVARRDHPYGVAVRQVAR